MARKNIKNLYLSTTSDEVKKNIENGGDVLVTSNLDVLIAERGLDYQRLANISSIRNMTISDIASCRKSKISLDHIISIMVALRITDIRDIINIEFKPDVIKQFKEERDKWVKEGTVPQQVLRQLNDK
ncbi:helix-turn-helix domain-containing protein [Clostridium sp. LBM24168]